MLFDLSESDRNPPTFNHRTRFLLMLQGNLWQTFVEWLMNYLRKKTGHTTQSSILKVKFQSSFLLNSQVALGKANKNPYEPVIFRQHTFKKSVDQKTPNVPMVFLKFSGPQCLLPKNHLKEIQCQLMKTLNAESSTLTPKRKPTLTSSACAHSLRLETGHFFVGTGGRRLLPMLQHKFSRGKD